MAVQGADVFMFFDKENRQKKKIQKQKRKEKYDKVYALHEKAAFLCYINDAYPEKYDGVVSMKLEGVVAKGTGQLEDVFLLFDCEGRKKAVITMEELYCGNNSVNQLEGGDKRVALYPREQEVPYCAGDILCKLKDEKGV